MDHPIGGPKSVSPLVERPYQNMHRTTTPEVRTNALTVL